MDNKKNFALDIFIMVLCAIIGFIFLCVLKISNEQQTQEKEVTVEYVYVEAEPEIIVETEYVPIPTDEFLRDYLTEEDEYYLMDIGMREAGNQGVIGQCWVMYTVLCRCEAYGKTIKQVCESSAFESSAFASGATPNDDCKEALELIKEGWKPKPLWFRKDYYHNFGTPLCQYGDHCFSMK